MKLVSKITVLLSFYLFVVIQAFANGEESHAPGEEHNDVATVDPMLIIIPAVVILGGIVIWKVMFSKKQAPSTQAPQVHTEVPKATQPSNQPEKLEAKK